MGLCFPDCSFAVKADKLPQIEGFVVAVTSSGARDELIEGWDGLRGSVFGGRQLCRWAIYAGRGFFFFNCHWGRPLGSWWLFVRGVTIGHGM